MKHADQDPRDRFHNAKLARLEREKGSSPLFTSFNTHAEAEAHALEHLRLYPTTPQIIYWDTIEKNFRAMHPTTRPTLIYLNQVKLYA